MLGTVYAVLTRNTSWALWKDIMLIIEITETNPHPAAPAAYKNDLPRYLAAYGIPQDLILTALQKRLTLNTLRLCKPSP